MHKQEEIPGRCKSLPVQVSDATVKPPQSHLFYCILGASSHHQKSFPAPAASLAVSAPAPSLAALVLDPSRLCFLLKSGLRYGINLSHKKLDINGRPSNSEAPPIGKIQHFSKISLTLEPVMQFDALKDL